MPQETVLAHAPFRIDIGGPTDVGSFIESGFKGFVFNIAIRPGVQASITPLEGTSVIIESLDLGAKVVHSNIENLDLAGELSLLNAIVLHERPNTGFHLRTSTGLPPGSGLGASASLAVATLSAFKYFNSDGAYVPDPEELANEALFIEQRYLGITGGSQDQYAAAYGGCNAFTYEVGNMKRERIVLDDSVIDDLMAGLVIVHSGRSRFSGEILEAVVKRFKSDESESIIRRLTLVAEQAKHFRNSIMNGDLEQAGKSLTLAWRAQKALHSGFNTPQIDDIVRIAESVGILGAKALGAAGGGCVLILSEPKNKAAIVGRLSR